MNTEMLSQRLQAVANFIPNGARLADIGSDHAYLPCHVVKKGQVSFAVAGEVVDGPYRSALKNVASEGLSDTISVRKGSGLEVIQPGEVECITISGMGGSLITSILEAGKDKLSGIKRLVLQPNIHAQAIREWLIPNGWELKDERILEEDNKIYEILVAEPGDSLSPYKERKEAALLFGPFLMKNQNQSFKKKWQLEVQNWERILVQLENVNNDSEETITKKEELQNKINMAKEIFEDEKS